MASSRILITLDGAGPAVADATFTIAGYCIVIYLFGSDSVVQSSYTLRLR